MIWRMRHGYTPTLPELQAFAEAAKHGSATRAALALGLTQSAISRSLASLEARLGVALVPEMLVQDDLAAGAVRLSSKRRMRTGTPYVMTYPARSLGVPAFVAFRDWLIRDVAAGA